MDKESDGSFLLAHLFSLRGGGVTISVNGCGMELAACKVSLCLANYANVWPHRTPCAIQGATRRSHAIASLAVCIAGVLPLGQILL